MEKISSMRCFSRVGGVAFEVAVSKTAQIVGAEVLTLLSCNASLDAELVYRLTLQIFVHYGLKAKSE